MMDRNVNDLLSLRGRVVLITGATGHLGRAMATALAEGGASVVVSSRRLSDAQDVTRRLPVDEGAKHHAVTIDQLDETSIQAGFAAALQSVGRIDALVANAHDSLASDWTNVTAEQFNRQLANATGYFLLSRLVRDHAVEQKSPASIVLLGSMYGVVGSYPEVYTDISAASPVAYHALKGGIVQMARHLAVYWAKDQVRVNCLSPGAFPSPKAPAELVRRLEQRTPLGRIGQPQELKGAVVFLCSDGSSFMTGQNLLIDGGWTAW